MKKISDFLVFLFGGNCFINLINEKGSLADGIFLIAVVVYFFTLLDVKLPTDQ